MPELNRRQFAQDPIEGFYGAAATPHGLGGRLPAPLEAPTDELGPNTKRGVVGQGQQMLNFDVPHRQLEVADSGLIPVDSDVDPDWNHAAWYVGGARRVDPADRDERFPKVTDTDDVITAGWESAPVETIGPDTEVRTNQADTAWGEAPAFVIHDEDKVADIRSEGDLAYLDPDTGTEQFPWVADVAGKRYLMEGHHRAIAARTRGSGEFPAHVVRGGNWGQIEDQLYDGARRVRDA